MKLYQIVLASLVVSTAANQKAKADEANAATTQTEINHKLAECKESKNIHRTEECELLENAFQQMLKLNNVDMIQKKYLDGGVQLEMQYEVMMP